MHAAADNYIDYIDYYFIADDEAIKIPSSPSILDANCSFGGHRRSCFFFFFFWGRRIPVSTAATCDF
jgi:hypothetical protein